MTWGYIYPATLIREETLLGWHGICLRTLSSDGIRWNPSRFGTAARQGKSRAAELGYKLWHGLRVA